MSFLETVASETRANGAKCRLPDILIALRKLRARYQEGPSSTRTSVGWVDKSESQRAAEAAA